MLGEPLSLPEGWSLEFGHTVSVPAVFDGQFVRRDKYGAVLVDLTLYTPTQALAMIRSYQESTALLEEQAWQYIEACKVESAKRLADEAQALAQLTDPKTVAARLRAMADTL